jgi:hypothetical protein
LFNLFINQFKGIEFTRHQTIAAGSTIRGILHEGNDFFAFNLKIKNVVAAMFFATLTTGTFVLNNIDNLIFPFNSAVNVADNPKHCQTAKYPI